MTTQSIERSITAFLDGEDSLSIPNIIHSTEGAAKFGFEGALVGGVTVYSWAAPALVEGLGEDWLDSGWIDFRLRRPVYPGDEITTRVTPTESGIEFTMAKESGEVCIAGIAGMGEAEFYKDLAVPQSRIVVPEANPPAMLSPENLPVGEDMPAMAVPMSLEDAAEYADNFAKDPHRALARRECQAASRLDRGSLHEADPAHLQLSGRDPRRQPDPDARACEGRANTSRLRPHDRRLPSQAARVLPARRDDQRRIGRRPGEAQASDDLSGRGRLELVP